MALWAGLEDDAHDHEVGAIGHDLAFHAGLGRLPGDLDLVLEEGVETISYLASQPPSTGMTAPCI